MGSTQYPVQWVPRALSLGVKWPECEGDQSLPSSDKVTMRGPAPALPFMHRDDFTSAYIHVNISYFSSGFYTNILGIFIVFTKRAITTVHHILHYTHTHTHTHTHIYTHTHTHTYIYI